MRVVINRSMWLRGTGSHSSFLVRYSDEKMCCLGFLGIACGIDKAEMVGRTSPSDISRDICHKWPEGSLVPHQSGSYVVTKGGLSNSKIIRDAIEHNDDQSIDETSREILLKKDLLELGIQLEFED